MASKNNAAAAIQRNLAAINLDDETEIEGISVPTPTSNLLSNYAVKQIPFTLLEMNRFQQQLRPEGLKQETLTELAENIAHNGFTSVILVRPHPDKSSSYEIGHGHRRLEALKLATTFDFPNNKVKGWTKIPARIAEGINDTEWLDIAISENLSREDLTPFAIANSFQAIRDMTPGASLADIARRVGRSKSWVQRYDSINGAPDYLIDMIRQKPDSLEHLFILKRFPNKNLQKKLALQVMNGELTLKELKEVEEGQKGKEEDKISKKQVSKLDIDPTLSNQTASARHINRLEVDIAYFHQNLEKISYSLNFQERDKLEVLINKLQELFKQINAHP